jgi:prepilin-type processing-associated H-X9-DG protein
MNPYPTFKPDYPSPPATFPPNKEKAFGGNFVSPPGNFQKQSLWKPASEKALVADSRFWMIESNPPPANGPYPPAVVPQENINNSRTYTPGRADQTMIDIYRHGKYPGILPGTTTFNPSQGKIAFNILYADGHVTTSNEGREAYRALRMKFPG